MLEPDNLSEVARDSVQTTPKEVGVTGRGLVTESPIERIAKPQLIKAPREIEPPEVIAIEMTPEEQDVYALMGISPLIRLNREVKNPKSVILSVVLPGESNDAETLNEASVESATEASTLPVTTDEDETSQMLVTPSGEAPTLDESLSSAQVLVKSPTEVSTTELSTEPTDEIDGSRPIIRRRRRRSSAIEGDDSSAL